MWRQSAVMLGIIAMMSEIAIAQTTKYVIEATPVRKVSTTYSYEVRYPNLTATVWEVIVARPPSLPGQSVSKVTVEPAGVELTENSGLKQSVFRVGGRPASPGETKTFKVAVTTEVTMMSRKLVSKVDGGQTPVVKPLPAAEQKVLLAPTPRMNHDSKAFQKWLDESELRRTKTESDIDFGLRVHRAMRKTLKYKRPFDHDGKASETAKSGVGDCGCLSTVFVGAMRANGIAARELVGRMVKADEPFEKIEYGVHARAEFFAANIGWVPLDPAAGLGDNSPEGVTHFGKDAGDLLAFHLDGDLSVDSKLAGKVKLERMQGVAIWAHGRGTFDMPEVKENWIVKDLPMTPTKK